MLNLLWQEILIIKEYSFLIRNLSITTALAFSITVGLSEFSLNSARLTQQQRLEKYSTVILSFKNIKTLGFGNAKP